MLLIGQYDSPFVRRIAIALARYGMPFEQQPWSVWADADALARYNPLRRVPVLVLDDGEVLLESAAILDHLDEQVDPTRALLPRDGPPRRHGLRVAALATGLADKAVSLLYEQVLRPAEGRSATWVDRCGAQMRDTLRALETDRLAVPTPWRLGDAIGHPDIAVACALRFTAEAHPGLYRAAEWPALAAHAAACEALPEFIRIAQPLTVTLAR